MTLNQNIGFAGIGNMGEAILQGLLKHKVMRSGQIWIYDKDSGKVRAACRRYRVRRADSLRHLTEQVKILLLAVKPQDLELFGKEYRLAHRHPSILISILAGTPMKKIRQAAGTKSRLVRAMPNLGARVGESVTALTAQRRADLKLAETIFSGCGKTVILKEKFFDLVTALSGSGPAYFFFLMEMMMDFSAARGLSRKDAHALAVQTAVGAAALARQSTEAPAELRARVTSKKGTTEAAFKVISQKKVERHFKQAFARALRRGRELSRS